MGQFVLKMYVRYITSQNKPASERPNPRAQFNLDFLRNNTNVDFEGRGNAQKLWHTFQQIQCAIQVNYMGLVHFNP